MVKLCPIPESSRWNLSNMVEAKWELPMELDVNREISLLSVSDGRLVPVLPEP